MNNDKCFTLSLNEVGAGIKILRICNKHACFREWSQMKNDAFVVEEPSPYGKNATLGLRSYLYKSLNRWTS